MSIQQMNVHDCVRCGNPINYDDTDWCDVCDMSIFDDRMVERKKILTIENILRCRGIKLGIDLWIQDVSVTESQYIFHIQSSNLWDRRIIMLNREGSKMEAIGGTITYSLSIDSTTPSAWCTKEQLKDAYRFASLLKKIIEMKKT